MSVASAAPRARDAALLALIPLLLLGLALGQAPLFDIDEGAFAEATREMLATGDWLSTWLNGKPRFDKPILIYWLQAASVAVFGLTEWAFRLPSVFAATVWSVALGVFAWPRYGKQTAYLVTLITATSLGTFAIGRAATADSLLNCLIVLAITDAWRFIESENKAALRRMYLWIGLGLLTKGPVAILVPVAATFLYCASQRAWRQWLRAAFDLPGWAILLAVAVPWYAAALAIHGQAFIDGFIFKHNIGRFSKAMESHSGGVFYYAVVVPALLLPWTALFLRALASIRADYAEPLPRFLWLWSAFVILFFTLSGTKLPHYALYGCSPLFLLVALHRDRLKSAWLAGLPAIVLFALLAALPAGLIHAVQAGWIKHVYYAAQLQRAEAILRPSYMVATLASLALAVMITFALRRSPWQRVAMLAVVQSMLLAFVVTPFFGDLLQGPVRQAAALARQLGGPVVQWSFVQPSFSLYQDRVVPLREPQPGELALARIDRLPKDARVQVLYAEGGVLLVRRLP